MLTPLTAGVLHAPQPQVAVSEFPMNASSALKMSAIVLTGTVLSLTVSKHALTKVQAHERHDGCSLATLNGTYGYWLTGQVLQVGPIVGVGVSTFDGRGRLVAEGTNDINGNVVQGQITGTYTVNRDCTGTTDIVGTGLHSFVIVAGGRKMDLIDNNSAEVLTLHFTKMESELNDRHED